MSDYKFMGINVWTYSCNRAILWFGGKQSHYSDKGKRWLRYERGASKRIGLELGFGGEDRELTFVIGLGFFVLYFSINNIFWSNDTKLEIEALKQKKYKHELDFSDEGRSVGFMVSLDGGMHSTLSIWSNGSYSTSRTLKEKFDGFPYCEGVYKFWFLRGH